MPRVIGKYKFICSLWFNAERMMQFFLSFLVSLLTLNHVTVAEGSNYEDFISSDPNESEWTLGSSLTTTSLDLVDSGQIEFPFEPNNQELPQVVASAAQGCSSGGTQALDRLRPRGVDDDFCGSNIGPQDPPLAIPDRFPLNLEAFCPNTFDVLAKKLICASPNPANVQPSFILGATLLESEEGVFHVFSKFFIASK